MPNCFREELTWLGHPAPDSPRQKWVLKIRVLVSSVGRKDSLGKEVLSLGHWRVLPPPMAGGTQGEVRPQNCGAGLVETQSDWSQGGRAAIV